MLLYNVPKNRQGFTLIESISIAVIVGVIGAITAPHFWNMYKEFEVNQALNDLQGALQEAQRNAIKKSQTCTITLNTTTKKITGSSGCLLEERTLPSSVTIVHTSGSSTVSFDFRGETGSAKTIIFYNPDQVANDTTLPKSKSMKKCLVISSGIGLMRSGNYINNPSTIDPDQCQVS